MKRAILVLTFAATLPFGALAKEPVKVVASFSILADIVREVGGDLVEVTSLVGPDSDAHVFDPSPQDAALVARADLVVVNGLGFEGWIDRLIEASGYAGPVMVASASIEPLPAQDEGEEEHDEHAEEVYDEAEHAEEEQAHEVHDHGAFDPHAWQSLANGALYAKAVAEALAKVDPANAQTYSARSMAYAQELEALDQWVKASVAGLPPEARAVVTNHDAFGYFEATYGIRFLAPLGVSTESEASASDVAKLIEQIRNEGVRALFIENLSDARLIERVEAETIAVFGGTLYSDALSGPEGPASTYLDLFRYNVETLLAALTGS